MVVGFVLVLAFLDIMNNSTVNIWGHLPSFFFILAAHSLLVSSCVLQLALFSQIQQGSHGQPEQAELKVDLSEEVMLLLLPGVPKDTSQN